MRSLAHKKHYTPVLMETEITGEAWKTNPGDDAAQRFLLIYQINEFCASATELMLDNSKRREESRLKLTHMMAEIMKVDEQLQEWASQKSSRLRPQRVERGGRLVTTYLDNFAPTSWNILAFSRIILHETLLRAAMTLGIESWTRESLFAPSLTTDAENSAAIIQELATGICDSIPFCLGDIDTQGNATTTIHAPGKAASSYLLMWPLKAVKVANFTTEVQKRQAHSALERIGRDVGIKQALEMLRERESAFEM